MKYLRSLAKLEDRWRLIAIIVMAMAVLIITGVEAVTNPGHSHNKTSTSSHHHNALV